MYRNLSLVYYNKLKDGVLALKAMEKAFGIDKSDARIFFELDQLYKTLNFSLEKRLANMNENSDLLEKRDDLYTEYITLLNMNGEYDNAYNRIMKKRFNAFIEYANNHMNDEMKIDYFAVSLPDFLIFEGDLNKNNKVHCNLMAALGYLGIGDTDNTKKYAKQGLELNQCHAELRDIVK